MSARPYFVIFAVMRTGSNLLEKTLGELGDTACYGEPFNPAFIGEPRYHDMLGWDLAARDADPLGFLARLRDAAGNAITGFRIFDGHSQDVMVHALADPDCRRIVLRRDPLASYISLKIARETGQWMLRDTRRRVTMRTRFDADEYAGHVARLEAHYAWLDAQMARAGTRAMQVDYAQLGDRSVLARIAGHIGSAGQVPTRAPIARQNPVHLAAKVANYEEMCAALGLEPEPLPTVPAIGPADIMLAERAPLAFAPLDGPGLEAGVSLIYRIERRAFDGPSHSQTELMSRARKGAFCPNLQSAGDPSGELSRRQFFAVTCHPAERAARLFEDAVFGPDWQRSSVRRRIVSLTGDLPGPRAFECSGAAFSADRQRAAFLAFLEVIAEARCGQGIVALPRAWLSQSTLLDLYAKAAGARPDTCDIADLQGLAIRLADRIGVASLPVSHVAAVEERALGLRLPTDPLLHDDVSSKLAELFADDLEAFAQARWPTLWTAGSTPV